MIAAPAGIKVLVATRSVDFGRGADSLAAVVREQLRHDPFPGMLFVFRSRRADPLKIVAWDGSGQVLAWKRRFAPVEPAELEHPAATGDATGGYLVVDDRGGAA
jgi:hypothetical protein